jgi:hypothetical protein
MTRLRRHLVPVAVLVALIIAVEWAPVVPPEPFDAIGQARAQIPVIAQGIITATNASVNAANTTSEQLLFQYALPGALMASWTTSNTAFASVPLHLKLNGTVVSTGAGAGTIGVNLGSALATVSVSNSGYFTPAAGGPIRIDAWISPIATVTTQNCTDLRPCNVSVYMAVRVESAFNNATGTQVQSGVALGTLPINVPVTLNVLHRWSAAASANSLNIYNGTLVVGE